MLPIHTNSIIAVVMNMQKQKIEMGITLGTQQRSVLLPTKPPSLGTCEHGPPLHKHTCTETHAHAQETLPQICTFAHSATVSFYGSDSGSSCALARPLEDQRRSTGIPLTFQVKAKAEGHRAKVTWFKKKKSKPITCLSTTERNGGSFQKAITHNIPKLHNGIHISWWG